jgi:hypothetical protein
VDVATVGQARDEFDEMLLRPFTATDRLSTDDLELRAALGLKGR